MLPNKSHKFKGKNAKTKNGKMPAGLTWHKKWPQHPNPPGFSKPLHTTFSLERWPEDMIWIRIWILDPIYIYKQPEMGKRRRCQLDWGRGQVVFPLIRFIFVIVLPRKMRVERQLNCLPGQTAIKNGNRKKNRKFNVCLRFNSMFVCLPQGSCCVVVPVTRAAGH